MRYRVFGTVMIGVYCVVDAESEEDACQRAEEELDTLTGFCGNGGDDKLLGVRGDECSVECSDTIEWQSAELLPDETTED